MNNIEKANQSDDVMARIAAKKKKPISFKKILPFILMCLPGMVYLIINNYLPLFGLVIAFKDINYSIGILQSPWNGFKNFEFLFATKDAFIITRNTILYNISFIAINTVVAVFVAIMLNEIRKKVFLKIYQSMILLPYLISMIVVAYLAYAMLSYNTGYINKTIATVFGAEPVSWYQNAKAWVFILPIINLWKQIGFLCVIYFASVIGIDTSFYDAATIDGANKIQQIFHITLPLIKPTIITMVLLAIGRIFYSDFGLFYQVPMNSGLIYKTTNVIDTYVYRALIQLGNVSMSSAAGFYQSIVGFVLVMTSNLVIKKIEPDNALF